MRYELVRITCTLVKEATAAFSKEGMRGRRCPLAQAVATPLVAGVAVTSGGVLCTGDLTNDFLAINASNGETLYRFNTGGAVSGGVITYEMDGKQYVATMSGVVSGFFRGTGTSAVVVFALP